jgi:midasin (ATPase involved in ribosome maturation)
MSPQCGGVPALYDGLSMSFLTQLDAGSHAAVERLCQTKILAGKRLQRPRREAPPDGPHVNLAFRSRKESGSGEKKESVGWWLSCGAEEPVEPSEYIMTDSVEQNLRNVARAVSSKRFPVLLQGPTSCGKTSMIEYLAKRTGHRFIRINNHEHTDIQEYLGSYVSDDAGKLVFQEGALVEAVRKGYWIVLDELNLAPTDVLEALNRLLDDNRELFIHETQTTVTPHKEFMLFATQNPPGLYGGRKPLSRAFRNRFVELHFDDLPSPELKIILEKRCQMPKSHCTTLVAILKDLQQRRQGTKVFAGKDGFITLRDLFRWAERYVLFFSLKRARFPPTFARELCQIAPSPLW